MSDIERRFVDALRVVAMKLQNAVDDGEKSSMIDAEDLIETLLSIADILDPMDEVTE